MELLLYAVAFYLWQCVAFLPAGGAAFVAWLPRRVGVVEGPGLRLLSPWPAGVNLVLGGLPLEIAPERVFTASPSGGRAGVAAAAEREAPIDRITVRGHSLAVGGRSLLRAATPAHAAVLASLVRTLGTPGPKWERQLDRALRPGFDLAAFRADLGSISRALRPLRWLCGAYVALVFGAVPLLAVLLDEEAAWWAALPAIGAVHLATLGALIFAGRRGGVPGARRFERVFIAALYPPALLRMPEELASERLAAYHPATAAAHLLDRERFLEYLGRWIAEVEHPRWKRWDGETVPAAAERERFLLAVRSGLVSLLQQVDEEEIPPRRRQDAAATSYCPICLGDYRAGQARCPSCGVPTVPYAGADEVG